MATNTPNYNLVKPSGNPPETGGDLVDITVLDSNLDIIDSALHSHDVSIAALQSQADYVSLYASAGQTLTTGVTADLLFDTEVEDAKGMHAAGNVASITLTKTGLWLFNGQVAYAGNATNARTLALVVNGVTEHTAGIPGSVAYNAIQINKVVRANSGQAVKLTTNQNSGGNLSTVGGRDNTFFVATYLGA